MRRGARAASSARRPVVPTEFNPFYKGSLEEK
ncbi:hypothetical protein BTRA_1453 [Burkholderia thailandensis USAMRU Malaysia |nr:hypothetical protein BTL_1224 [Burkholderia thailandensis H0587]AHI73297.1 hypothetical protein BTQ_2370 [Burkholderia thailandensis 2002721723]AHI77262.1 hypothetical protein BTJ_3314 [Burkholderia thailandensis E444]AIC87018.1 hypothetical protein BTRA_1453 [Burkholderia thailandensis USAMRU Malaysia \